MSIQIYIHMCIKVFPIGYIFLLIKPLMLQGVQQCRNQGQRRQQLRHGRDCLFVGNFVHHQNN